MVDSPVQMSAISTAAELRREWLAARLNAPHADCEALHAGLEFELMIARAAVLVRRYEEPRTPI